MRIWLWGEGKSARNCSAESGCASPHSSSQTRQPSGRPWHERTSTSHPCIRATCNARPVPSTTNCTWRGGDRASRSRRRRRSSPQTSMGSGGRPSSSSGSQWATSTFSRRPFEATTDRLMKRAELPRPADRNGRGSRAASRGVRADRDGCRSSAAPWGVGANQHCVTE
jgi:hypothetical protein